MTAHFSEKTKKETNLIPLTHKYMTAHFPEKLQKEEKLIP